MVTKKGFFEFNEKSRKFRKWMLIIFMIMFTPMILVYISSKINLDHPIILLLFPIGIISGIVGLIIMLIFLSYEGFKYKKTYAFFTHGFYPGIGQVIDGKTAIFISILYIVLAIMLIYSVYGISNYFFVEKSILFILYP